MSSTPHLSHHLDALEWITAHLAPHLSRAASILEVGCGAGVMAAEVARKYAAARVVGVDRERERLAEAGCVGEDLPNLSFLPADPIALPFASGSFEAVYTRFLPGRVTAPARVIGEMARVCTPGGRVIVQDVDGYLLWHHPIDPALQAGLERAVAALAAEGLDPLIGRKLYALAREAGLRNIDVKISPHHLHAGRIDRRGGDAWARTIEEMLPAIAAALGRSEAALLKRKLLEQLRDEGTLMYSVLFTVSGTRSRDN
jgi:SAM-dependent methyltransferase